MIFAILTLLTALSLAAVAGWFSIVGFMAIYAGAPMYALIMGVVTECAKLVTTSWLYRNWNYASWRIKAPLIYFTLALMVATSIGVFGFLSKAHLEQGSGTLDNSSKITQLQYQIDREKSTITDNEKVTKQLDDTVNSLLGKDRADRALSVRKSQAAQRKQLRDDSAEAQKRIDALNSEKFKYESEVRKMQLEVGPIRYIAELFYGVEENATKNIESAVRIFTLLLVSTLDPLAVILLIAANHTLLRLRDEKKKTIPPSGSVESDTHVTSITPAPGEEISKTSYTVAQTPVSVNVVQPWSDVSAPIAETKEEEIYVPVLQETVGLLNEEEVTDKRTSPPKESPPKDEAMESKDFPTPEISKDLVRSSQITTGPASSDKAPEIQEEIPTNGVTIGNKDESLEKFSPPKLDAIAPLPFVRSPVVSRIGDMPDTPSVKIPWAHQDTVLRELIGNSAQVPHFSPQKINQEEIPIASQVSKNPMPGPAAVYPKRTDDSETNNHKDVVLITDKDKYPKALSWLTEFRRL